MSFIKGENALSCLYAPWLAQCVRLRHWFSCPSTFLQMSCLYWTESHHQPLVFLPRQKCLMDSIHPSLQSRFPSGIGFSLEVSFVQQLFFSGSIMLPLTPYLGAVPYPTDSNSFPTFSIWYTVVEPSDLDIGIKSGDKADQGSVFILFCGVSHCRYVHYHEVTSFVGYDYF